MEKSIRERFGENVHQLRTEAGISKQRFSLMVGISRPYLDEIENGEANVTLDIIERVAEGLEMSPEELLG